MAPNKRALGVAAALLLFAGLVALQVWRTPKPQLPPTATLPDGSTLRLAKVSFGTAHFPPGPWWRPLVQRLPSDWQRRFGVVTGPGLSTTTPSLGVWLEQERAGNHSRWEFALVDEHGAEVAMPAASTHESSATRGPSLTGRAFTAFPRRGKMVLLRIYERAPAGGRTLQASFHFANPAPGPHREWRPQPPPARLRHGPVEFTFERLLVGVAAGNLARRPQPGEESQARVEFRVTERGLPGKHWVPDGIEVSDATGNSVVQQTWSGGNEQGLAHLTWSPHLWPSETAWKLRVAFMRSEQAPFSTNELIELKGIALPAKDGVTEVNLATNRLGHTIRVLGLTHGRGQFPGQQLSMSGADTSLRVEATPELAGKRLSLVGVRDNRGRTVERRGWGRSGQSYAFRVMPVPDAKSLDFTLAVQEVVTGEFVVKPALFVPEKFPVK